MGPADQFDGTEAADDKGLIGATKTLSELQAAATKAGTDVPPRSVKEALVTVKERAVLVRTYARLRSAGICEACDKAATFQT